LSIVQTTLSGGETDEERTRPNTFQWCEHCEDFVLRSRWPDHEEHHLRAAGKFYHSSSGDAADDDGEEEDETVEKVGAWYDVTISKSADYRFSVPAYSEHRAKEIAKEWSWDAMPADAMVVHTETREMEEIWEDDETLPDDFDPYSSERVYDAMQRAKDDDTEDSEPRGGDG